MSEEVASEPERAIKRLPPLDEGPTKEGPTGPGSQGAAILRLQRLAGNRAVQRLLQRQGGEEGFELNQATAGRINRAR